MQEPQVIQALLYLDDGQEVLVEPVHGADCAKGSTRRIWTGSCPGCRFDLLAKELLSLHRPMVTDVNHREEVTGEQD